MKKCFAIALTLVTALAISSNALAAPTGTYNSGTGEITVNIDGVVNWYVEHEGFDSMTGAAPMNLPGGGGLVTDNDTRIGETAFAPLTYAFSLGNVAATGIADDGTLKIFWNATLGSVLESAPISFGGPMNQDPTAAINGPFVVNVDLPGPYDITLDASGSSDPDGDSLTYKWDLDDDGTFEVDTAGVSSYTFDASTLGPKGLYNVAVEVSDGNGGTDTASTTVELIPEPSTFALAGLALIGCVARRRRS